MSQWAMWLLPHCSKGKLWFCFHNISSICTCCRSFTVCFDAGNNNCFTIFARHFEFHRINFFADLFTFWRTHSCSENNNWRKENTSKEMHVDIYKLLFSATDLLGLIILWFSAKAEQKLWTYEGEEDVISQCFVFVVMSFPKMMKPFGHILYSLVSLSHWTDFTWMDASPV